MTKARASTILVFLLSTLSLAGQPSTPSWLAQETFERLQRGEEISHTLWGSERPELIPASGFAAELASELEALDFTIGVEVLRLYSAPAARLDSQEAMLAVYNVLRSVSSMEGIEYYSVTRGRMRTLFVASYVIEDPVTQKRIPDELVAAVPEYSMQYVFQEDLTFGKNVYRAEYLARPEGFVLKTRNLTQMRYYFLPMVKPENSLTVIAVLPFGNHVLFYGVMAAHAFSLFGIERSREESFYNRLNALYGWFTRQVAAVLDED